MRGGREGKGVRERVQWSGNREGEGEGEREGEWVPSSVGCVGLGGLRISEVSGEGWVGSDGTARGGSLRKREEKVSYQMIPCQRYQNSISVKHVSKHVLRGSYFCTHVSHLLDFDLNNVSFDTKYF